MSRGPSDPPIRCSALELKDLADTQSFHLNAEVGSIYGFEYTESGFYNRVEIEDKKIPKLEQLRNVVAEPLFNAVYKIGRKGQKWHFQPKVRWDLKYEFISPYILFDHENKFRKALNAGHVHCSIVPNSDSSGKIDVTDFQNQYMLTSTTASGLTFVPHLTFSENFTLIFEVLIKEGSLDNSADNRSIEVIGGVQINWLKLTKENQNVTVVLRKDQEGLDGMRFATSVDKVTIHIVPSRMNGLEFFDLTHLHLVSLYYRRTDLPDKLIEMLTQLQMND